MMIARMEDEVQYYCWVREAGILFPLPFGTLHHHHLPPDDLPILHHLHQKTQSIINHHVQQHNDLSVVLLNILSDDDAKTHGAD